MTISYALASDEWATPRGARLRMIRRDGTNDWNTLNASLGSNDEYGLATLNLTGWALDIGGYLGSVAIALAVDNPGLDVICVEPVPWNVDLIADNAKINGVGDRVHLISGMVGPPGVKSATVRHSYRGNEALEHHAFVGNTSLTYELPGVEEHDETEVPVYSQHALNVLAGEPFSFVKIDCEGGEWGWLQDDAVRDLAHIRGEWHPVPYTGRGMTQGDLTDALGETHAVTFTGPVAGPGGFEAVRRG